MYKNREKILNFISDINSVFWGYIMLALFVATGVFLTLRLKFLPWRKLPYALKSVCMGDKTKEKSTGITPFQSLMTALAATIGTGNIAGVATAIVLGGPGALVWMWISAIFGMATKYSECLLSVLFRKKNSDGEFSGGPMYVMQSGFKTKWIGSLLSVSFCVFTLVASFSVGNMIQVHSISTALSGMVGVPVWISIPITALLVALILMGGIKSIGKVCGFLVPIMAGLYILGGLFVILFNLHNFERGIGEIFSLSLNPAAAGGGLTGVFIAMRYGVSRGVFSNEAGLGSAPIVAAAAQIKDPVKQGYISMTGTFIDTLVVCTVTGLAIVCSGVLDSGLTGVSLTIAAFKTGLGDFGGFIVCLCLVLFAFSTIIGWEYYGAKSIEFLSGSVRIANVYKIIYITFILIPLFFGVSEIVWEIADTTNALMALPNLISLLAMSGIVVNETNKLQKSRK